MPHNEITPRESALNCLAMADQIPITEPERIAALHAEAQVWATLAIADAQRTPTPNPVYDQVPSRGAVAAAVLRYGELVGRPTLTETSVITLDCANGPQMITLAAFFERVLP